MKKMYVCAALIVVFALTMALAGCPKKTETPPAGAGTSTVTPPAGGGEEVNDDEASADTGDGVALTAELMDQWLAATEDDTINEIMDEIKSGDDDDPMAIAAALDSMSDNAKLDDAVKAHGFADADEFIAVTKKAMSGMMTAMLEPLMEMTKSMGGDETEGSEEMAEMEGQIEAAKEAFGELSDDEMEIVKATIAKMEGGGEGGEGTE